MENYKENDLPFDVQELENKNFNESKILTETESPLK